VDESSGKTARHGGGGATTNPIGLDYTATLPVGGGTPGTTTVHGLFLSIDGAPAPTGYNYAYTIPGCKFDVDGNNGNGPGNGSGLGDVRVYVKP
jgi:hypothetical protein